MGNETQPLDSVKDGKVKKERKRREGQEVDNERGRRTKVIKEGKGRKWN